MSTNNIAPPTVRAIDPPGPYPPESLRTDFWEGATFLPLDEPSRSNSLLGEVWKYHQASFLAFTLNLAATNKIMYRAAGLDHSLERFRAYPADKRRRLMEYTPFLTWLKLSVSCDPHSDDLKRRLPELKRILSRFDQGARSPERTIPGTRLAVARFDVDPLIMEAALPEYHFPDRRRQHEFEGTVPYPLEFFSEMITLALERIRRAWPPAYDEFFKFVRLIVDMIDSDFTSYSGYQHIGVIFVSTDNSPLVALEEYLIHEFGHQILYNVTELDPVVVDRPGAVFSLPWSGRKRDIYGYFHAFYIYTFLAHYLRRVESRSRREQRRVSDRLTHILKGLNRAANELKDLDAFTARGKRLFENLRSSMSPLSRATNL
jgi:hypothetical protein